MTSAVDRLLERAADAALAQGASRPEVLAAILTAFAALQMESTPAEREDLEAQALLAEYDRMGADRAAAAKVARKFAPRNDPQALESVAHRVRRLARRRKADSVRLAG